LKIEFGTDGWRGIIGRDFNFKNIEKIGYAIINFLNKKPNILPFYKDQIIVGYDTRFLGKETALFLSEIFSDYGLNVFVSKNPIPTPALSYGVFHYNLPIGIMITASHNPAIYNGIKIKAWYGGSALPEIYERVKDLMEEKKPKKNKKGKIEEIDLKEIYINYLKKNVNWEIIKKYKGKILWDSMYGATTEIIKILFKEMASKTKILNPYPDPYFGGTQPEPIPNNLKETIRYIKKFNYDIAGISDGDGDRIGIITKEGIFLWNQIIFSLLALYQLEEKKEDKGIAKTFSSSYYLDKIAKMHNVPIYETKIGFKYLCPLLIKKKVFIAGEESGGIAFSKSLPERDAILSFLKILEMVSEKQKNLEDFLKKLKEDFGELYYDRIDIEMNIKKAKDFVENIFKSKPKEVAGFDVLKIKKLDGVKIYFKRSGWLLFRASGTENLLRVYCEMEKKEEIEKIFKYIKNYVRNF